MKAPENAAVSMFPKVFCIVSQTKILLNVYSFKDFNVDQMRIDSMVLKFSLNLSDSWKTFHQPQLEDNEKEA